MEEKERFAPEALLGFLATAGRLRVTYRHCHTDETRREDVADHSWRLALLSLLLRREFPGIDGGRLTDMCLVHDLGEAITGDIPVFRKTREDEAVEAAAIQALLARLPETTRGYIAGLFAEMDAQQTEEARLWRALDKMEAVASHNEAPLSTWSENERSLNLTYAAAEASPFPELAELRAAMLRDTQKKLAAEKK